LDLFFFFSKSIPALTSSSSSSSASASFCTTETTREIETAIETGETGQETATAIPTKTGTGTETAMETVIGINGTGATAAERGLVVAQGTKSVTRIAGTAEWVTSEFVFLVKVTTPDGESWIDRVLDFFFFFCRHWRWFGHGRLSLRFQETDYLGILRCFSRDFLWKRSSGNLLLDSVSYL